MLYSPVATHSSSTWDHPPQSPRLAICGPRAAGPIAAHVVVGTTNIAAGPCSAHSALGTTSSGTTHVPAEAPAGRVPAADRKEAFSPSGGLWIARRIR